MSVAFFLLGGAETIDDADWEKLVSPRFDNPPGDNLVRCLKILMQASTLLSLPDPLRRGCSRSSSRSSWGWSSGYCLSARLDG